MSDDWAEQEAKTLGGLLDGGSKNWEEKEKEVLAQRQKDSVTWQQQFDDDAVSEESDTDGDSDGPPAEESTKETTRKGAVRRSKSAKATTRKSRSTKLRRSKSIAPPGTRKGRKKGALVRSPTTPLSSGRKVAFGRTVTDKPRWDTSVKVAPLTKAPSALYLTGDHSASTTPVTRRRKGGSAGGLSRSATSRSVRIAPDDVIARLRKELEMAHTELFEVKSKNAELQIEDKKLRASLEMSEEQLTAAKEELAQLKASTDASSAKAAQDIADKQAQVESLVAEKDNLKNKISELTEHLEGTTLTLENLKKTVQTQQEEWDARRTALEEELAALRKTHDEQTSALRAVEEERDTKLLPRVAELETSLAAATQQQQEQSAKAEELQRTLASTNEELQGLQLAHSSLKAEHEERATEVTELRDQLQKGKADNQELVAKEEEYHKQLQVLESQLTTITEQVSNSETHNEELETENLALKQKVEEQSASVAALTSEVESKTDELTQLNRKHSQLQAEASWLQEKEESTQTMLNASKEALQDALVDLERKTEEIARTRSELTSASSHSSQLALELDDARRELTEAKDRLRTAEANNKVLQQQADNDSRSAQENVREVQRLEQLLEDKKLQLHQVQLEKDALTTKIGGNDPQLAARTKQMQESFESTIQQLKDSLENERDSFDKLMEDLRAKDSEMSKLRQQMNEEVRELRAQNAAALSEHRAKETELHKKLLDATALADDLTSSKEILEAKLARETEKLTRSRTESVDQSSVDLLEQEKTSLQSEVERLQRELEQSRIAQANLQDEVKEKDRLEQELFDMQKGAFEERKAARKSLEAIEEERQALDRELTQLRQVNSLGDKAKKTNSLSSKSIDEPDIPPIVSGTPMSAGYPTPVAPYPSAANRPSCVVAGRQCEVCSIQ